MTTPHLHLPACPRLLHLNLLSSRLLLPSKPAFSDTSLSSFQTSLSSSSPSLPLCATHASLLPSSSTLPNATSLADFAASSDGQASSLAISSSKEQENTWTTELLLPVEDDLRTLEESLQKVMSEDNPLLMAAAEQIFGAGGKRMRPALVFLVSRATAQLTGLRDLTPQHRRLAEIIEMIHTANLIHDDVQDESDVWPGKDNVHQRFGTRVAVLAGDFIFAQTSWFLANLENIEVIKLISQVIKDFSSGEIKHAANLYNCETSLQDCLRRSYCKTASLIAASTRSAAIFSGASTDIRDQMFDYGKNLGLAFQIVDDILDFTQSSEGKPAGNDLLKGNLTLPVICALRQESKLQELIQSKFVKKGALEAAIQIIHESGGIDQARDLARQKGEAASDCLQCLLKGPTRSSLEGMVDSVIGRLQ